MNAKKSITKALTTAITAATMLMQTVLPVHASDVEITPTEPTGSISVTATVNSNFSVQLPMSIALTESATPGANGPVFESTAATKLGVKGTLYGKALTVSAKDGRAASATYDTAGKLTLAPATYDEGTTTYTVTSEEGAVSADVDLAKNKFYPAGSSPSGEKEAVIVAGDEYTEYAIDIHTTSAIVAGANSLFYGKLTFTVALVDTE